MVADHELVAADGLETMAFVEPQRPMIVDEHRQVEIPGATPAGFFDGPAHQYAGDAGAMMLLEDIELVDEQRRPVRLDWDLERPELHVADRLPVHLGETEGKVRVPQLFFPVSDTKARQEGIEVV